MPAAQVMIAAGGVSGSGKWNVQQTLCIPKYNGITFLIATLNRKFAYYFCVPRKA